ncbi:hypothetical protein NUW58_g10850 [Xylaria curta]|uniref:Uncharacterized protein n=1 Tax=Xylaria curta TaxID=42375 RepID=A0ACC1MG17_9PEZI|nr:hypothetical protein NUW58_g10850 [Xylaria curta]
MGQGEGSDEAVGLSGAVFKVDVGARGVQLARQSVLQLAFDDAKPCSLKYEPIRFFFPVLASLADLDKALAATAVAAWTYCSAAWPVEGKRRRHPYLVTLLSSSSNTSWLVVHMFSFTTMTPLILPSSSTLSTALHFNPSTPGQQSRSTLPADYARARPPAKHGTVFLAGATNVFLKLGFSQVPETPLVPNHVVADVLVVGAPLFEPNIEDLPDALALGE